MAHFVGTASEFTLIITLSTTGGDVLVDADATPTVAVKDSTGATVATPTPVAHPSLGTYTVDWTPTGAGDFTVNWAFIYSGDPFTSVENAFVWSISDSPAIPSGAPGYVAEIQVVDEDGAPVETMGVQVYDVTNTTLIASGFTDSAGEVDIILPAARYQLRFYGEHLLASVTSPRQIKVRVPPPSNLWRFTATTFTPPVSPNPYMCRCWGYFRDSAGMPLANLLLRLLPQQDPAVFGALVQAMGQGALQLATDANGYVQVDLPRGGLFEVVLGGYMDSAVEVTIPAQAGFNLVDLLFPTPVSLTFAPVGPTALAVGGVQLYVPSLTMSDGRVLTQATDDQASNWVDFVASVPAVLSVGFSTTGVQATGVGVGASTLSATVKATAALPRVPPATFTVTPVALTVT